MLEGATMSTKTQSRRTGRRAPGVAEAAPAADLADGGRDLFQPTNEAVLTAAAAAAGRWADGGYTVTYDGGVGCARARSS